MQYCGMCQAMILALHFCPSPSTDPHHHARSPVSGTALISYVYQAHSSGIERAKWPSRGAHTISMGSAPARWSHLSFNVRSSTLCDLWSSKGIIENAKLPLLQQLKRNMPNYFVCHCCFLLHQYDGSGSLGLTCLRPNWNCPLPCIRRAQWKVGHLELDTHDDTAHICYLFHFLHIQLAMRRFSHGPRCGTTV